MDAVVLLHCILVRLEGCGARINMKTDTSLETWDGRVGVDVLVDDS